MIRHLLIMRFVAFAYASLNAAYKHFKWRWIVRWLDKCCYLWCHHNTLFNLCNFREYDKRQELRRGYVMARYR